MPSTSWLIKLRDYGESKTYAEIALVRTNDWWSDHITINHLLRKGYEIDRIVPGSEGWLITLRKNIYMMDTTSADERK
jgi:hypothetical protein